LVNHFSIAKFVANKKTPTDGHTDGLTDGINPSEISRVITDGIADGNSIGNYGMTGNFVATLCVIPTDRIRR